VVYSAVLTLWSADVLAGLYELSRADSSSSHLVLIPAVSAFLIVQNRERVFSTVEYAWRSGLVAATAGLTVMTVGVRGLESAGLQASLPVSVAGLTGAWAGGFLLFYGRRAVAAACFPLCFLALTVPLPAVALSGATAFLKVGSAEAVAGLFEVTGVPFHRSGYVFTLPGLAIEIADACSGIRSSIALALTSLLLGHWSLRSTWGRVLLVASVLPLAIVKNAVRIVALSLLAIYVDPAFMVGSLHNDGGVLFFLLALFLLGIVLASIRRLEVRAGMPEATSTVAATLHGADSGAPATSR
jgi:exosortase